MTQLRNPARLDAWMYAIMRKLWDDENAAGRARQYEGATTAPEVAEERPHDSVAEDPNSAAAVRRALHDLSAEQRSVLILVCVDGMSYKKTAEILGIPPGSVVSLLSAARAALAERLSVETPQNGEVIALASKFGRRGSER
jgi:RNA polymerase sigma-70 factor, ECF subfamily